MAQLGNTIINGVLRVLDKVQASEFVGNLTGTADDALHSERSSGVEDEANFDFGDIDENE